MKKISYAFFICCLFAARLSAQFCGTTANCTTIDTFTQPGLYPSSYCLSPVVIGTNATTTFQFKNFDTVVFAGTVIHINSLKIDSINNLPPGLCWSCNSPNQTYNAGETGCINMSGTPTGNSNAGQYQLRIIVDVNTRELGTLSGLNAEAAGLFYYVRAVISGDACPHYIDTSGQAAGTIAPIIKYVVGECPNTGVQCNTGAPITPQGSLTAGGPACGVNGTELTFTATAGKGPFTLVFDAGTSRSTALGVVSGSPFGGSSELVGSTTTYTLLSVTGEDGGVRSSGFTQGSVSIKVYPALKTGITANGPTTFCEGDSVTLTAKAGSGYKFKWSTDATTNVITTTTSGSYGYTVSGNGGCQVASLVKKVTVNALPAAKITVSDNTLCTGGTAKLTVTKQKAGGTYDWSNGDTTQAITVSATGIYKVTVSTKEDCTASASHDITCTVHGDVADKTGDNAAITNAATAAAADMNVSVYPNPYNGQFHLLVTGGSNSNINVMIYDITGKLLDEKPGITPGDDVILGGTYADGVYIVRVLQANTSKEVKVVKTE